MSTYYESADGIVLSRARALAELRSHGVDDPSEFFEECGDCPTYTAQYVLEWLGY